MWHQGFWPEQPEGWNCGLLMWRETLIRIPVCHLLRVWLWVLSLPTLCPHPLFSLIKQDNLIYFKIDMRIRDNVLKALAWFLTLVSTTNNLLELLSLPFPGTRDQSGFPSMMGLQILGITYMFSPSLLRLSPSVSPCWGWLVSMTLLGTHRFESFSCFI